MTCETLILIILIIIFFVVLFLVGKNVLPRYNHNKCINNMYEKFTNCKNKPPEFLKKFSQTPPLFNGIHPIKNIPIGANETMVLFNNVPDKSIGSCYNNINGINKAKQQNRYGKTFPHGIQSYAFCGSGADNPFDN